MRKFQYVTSKNLISKFHRDFRGLELNESDAIEWIGEALGYMKIPSAMEKVISYREVKNHKTPILKGSHYIINIARDNNYTPKTTCEEAINNCVKVAEECETTSCEMPDIVDCNGNIIFENREADLRPNFDMQWEYGLWNYRTYTNHNFSPVVLSNHSFFNSVVCKDEDFENLYRNCGYDEYSILGDSLTFSFAEGAVAISHWKQLLDDEGYPMIPDDEYARQAATYYILWKIKERESYLHREGARVLAKDAQANWGEYIKKFKNKAKMPTGADQYNKLANQSRYLIPKNHNFYGYFGNLGKIQHYKK